MKTKLPADAKLVISNNNGLKLYLESLLKGRDFTPRSWLYESEQPDDVLQSWKNKLAQLENGNLYEKEVFQFDTSSEAKWGPQGGIAPISELQNLISEGFGDPSPPKAFEEPEWHKAKQTVIGMLKAEGIQSLRPASYKHVVDDMRARDTLESNSGWPLFTRRNKPEVVRSSIEDAENGRWKTYPAIALFRNYNQKTRLVWMFPMSANLVEGSYFQPLQSAIMRSRNLSRRFFAPWTGFEQVRIVVDSAYESNYFLAASDFSSTDAHFTLYSSLEVCDVIENCFQGSYRAGLRESIEYMHTIPLVTGPDSMEVGKHGVSSGSNWTNFIETIFDWIFSYYVMYKLGTYSGLYAIGDDMSWVSRSYDEEFAKELERLGELVGQIIRQDKTTNDPDKVKSLQRLFQRGYSRPDGMIRGVYPTIRALKSSIYPERFHDPRKWSKDMFCARQFMILENCVDHPLFEEFVRFVCAGSEYLVPFARLSRSRLDQILRESKLLPGLNPTYNQERRDQSFADFESVRIASRL